ncbi:ParB/RepB/Spo0J family partition protein [Pararhizobium mangrovi]|uniref:ParB/RepB/Spo0J family partition protein n=1 Tax=Pararhizobium mangrovi TaxID=2590452 RepID=A0A506TYU8_9HYPH|nr:ParB/RepB/Spo0J family partition protein [Pararhizobium mangrovi]TPW27273.1 ParB/RepB/Spo0J family partition protein [Pararhizobium mangrovi]
MNEDGSRRRLGRGLAALIGDMDQPSAERNAPALAADTTVPIEFVGRNPRNPRRSFDEDDLADLANSIRRHGIVQPVVVRPAGHERYEIIAGERRWRAAQLAGIATLPVLVRDVDDRAALEIAIVENVQRADLNPMEEAHGYEQLIAEHGYTQHDLGDIIGKSRSHVANSLRLLKLPEPVRDLVSHGALSAGHARAIASTADPSSLARRIVSGGLSVREAEKIAQREAEGRGRHRSTTAEKDADTLALERRLGDRLGLKVSVNHRGERGSIRIDYASLDQLDALCHLLDTQR